MSVDLASDSADLIRSYVRELAELVLPSDLDKYGDFEIVKLSIHVGTVGGRN